MAEILPNDVAESCDCCGKQECDCITCPACGHVQSPLDDDQKCALCLEPFNPGHQKGQND